MSIFESFLRFIYHRIVDIVENVLFECLYFWKIVTIKSCMTFADRNEKIIISLTTFPQRIRSAAIVIADMFIQTVKPDKIILYLAAEEFENKKLPYLLLKEQKNGVEIVFCENLYSHKKYFYTMQNYPHDVVITIDDDFRYKKDLIERLLLGYKKNPNCVSCCKANRMLFDNNNNLLPYNEWKDVDELFLPSLQNVAIGVGGVLYPPSEKSLHIETFSKDMIFRTCINADDLWLKIMEVMNEIPVQKVCRMRVKYVPASQRIALFKKNFCVSDCGKSKNDIQLENILKFYNEYFSKEDTLLNRIKANADYI